MILRNNFYDWKVSVDSKIPINIDFLNLFDTKEKIHSVYCEGFKEEQVFGCYEENKNQFSFSLSDDFKLYTFLFLLKEGV